MERRTARAGALRRVALVAAFCVAVGGAQGLVRGIPAMASAGCAGVAVGIASTSIAAGQTATLAITASGVPTPGVAGFQLTVSYDPSTVRVSSAQGGVDFPDTAANTGQAGSVVLVGASAQGFPGSPVLAVLSVQATATAGSVANLTVTSSQLIDSNLNTIASCGQSGALTVTGAQATALQVTSTLLPSGLTGTPYSQPLSAVGGTGAYGWGVTAGALPAGLSLDPTTGVLSGTPTGWGVASFTVVVTDGAGHSATHALRLLVNPAGATLAVSTASLPGGSVGAPYSAGLSATGGTGPYTWMAQGTLPPGLSLQGATISGMPTAAGTTSFTVQVTDASSPAQIATLPLTIVVAPAHVAVTATSTATTTSATTPVTSTVSNTTATAAGGTGTVTTGQYDSNPQTSSAQPFQSGGSYFDVDVAPESAFQVLTIQQCGVTTADTLYWWDGTTWAAVSPQSSAGGCVTATLQASGTSPTIGELTGTPFAAVAAAASGGGGTVVVPLVSLPVVTGISPATGGAGTVVTITGTGFYAPLTVHFGTAAAAAESIDAAGGIVATAPAGSGTVDVTVTTGLGTSPTSPAAAFTYPPVVPAATPGPVTFPDVPATYWAARSIASLAAKGIVAGMPDGTFAPDAQVTRAEFVKMLVLARGLAPGAGPSGFADVAAGDWFTPYVTAAAQAGLVQGTSATAFSPNAPLSREQMAVLLARALKLTGSAPLTFSDASTIDAWAGAGVQSAVAAGYITGFPDGTFQPHGIATRAQAAQVLAEVLAKAGGG